MSVVGHAPPPFFKRGPAPLARLAFFTALSAVLLVADQRFHTLEWARLVMASIVWPLQRTAQMPAEAGERAARYFSNLVRVQEENEILRGRSLATANQLLRQEHLENENRRLRALIDMKERQPVAGRIADILYAARDPFSRRVIINKGMQAGIEPGQSVVDDLGVIGQVTRVFPLTAEVTLLTDKDQAIPVQVQRNGLRAVAAGGGAGSLELKFLASNAEVQPGDILVTSGLDGVYLPGLPVARIAQIDRDNSFSFARIRCDPIAGVEAHGLVLVLDKRQVPPQPDEVVESVDKPAKGRKVRKTP